jgi:hypothetical protein
MKKSFQFTIFLLLIQSSINSQNIQSNTEISSHYVGERFQGGVIVHLQKDSNNLEHGLICSLEDISSSYVFSNVLSEKIGKNAEDRNDGRKNIPGILNQTNHTTSAAKLCDDYTFEAFNDWYLPSISELRHCYNAKTIIEKVLQNGKFNSQYYWSSTEDFYGNFAYYLNFVDGTSNEKFIYYKEDLMGVRAVRRF